MAGDSFTFLSADKRTRIHCVVWKPKGEPKGILQITHGMVEYIERYEAFAEYMNSQGYLVAGHDHLGHGESVGSKEDWGFFAEEKGSDILVEDMHRLRITIQKQYFGLPYFMLGHSMGSFLLRKYLCLHSQGLAGAIVMGTGSQPDGVLCIGKALCCLMARFRGWRYRSPLIQKMAFAGNDNKFRGENRKNSWLTKDEEIVKAYSESPKCTFQFTLNGFYNLFDTIWYINRKKHLSGVRKDLPMLFVSGEDDPVGAFGSGVRKACRRYRALGVQDITMKLYPSDRHEILNELDRKQVYKDIARWIARRNPDSKSEGR